MRKSSIVHYLLLSGLDICSARTMKHGPLEGYQKETVASRETLGSSAGSTSLPQHVERVDSLFDALNDILRNVPTASPEPTESPTESPAPSPSPSEIPTATPTSTPEPTAMPSESPTESPAPSPSPSEIPSQSPSASPSALPSFSPSDAPSLSPSESPSLSTAPSDVPSLTPSASPSDYPSAAPSSSPSLSPSASPSSTPSGVPSSAPSDSPSVAPSDVPSASPTSVPSYVPSTAPSDTPSQSPSVSPSAAPSGAPSASPSLSVAPSSSPSAEPSASPSSLPSVLPSASPSLSQVPSSSPTLSLAPSGSPSDMPSGTPSSSPTRAFEIASTSINLLLEHVDAMMDEGQNRIFENTVLQFMQDNIPEDDVVDVTILSAIVTEETVVVGSRSLEATQEKSHRRLHNSGLSVNFDVTGKVSPSPPPDDFSFEYFVGRGFAENFTAFGSALANQSDFFAALVMAEEGLGAAGAERASGSTSTESGLSSKGAIGVIVGSVAALAVAVVASVVSLRKRRSSYIEEVDDNNEYDGSQISSKRTRYSAREVPTPMSARTTSASQRPDVYSPRVIVMDGAKSIKDLPSPNTVENGNNNMFCDVPNPFECPDPNNAAFATTPALADSVVAEPKELDEETVKGPFGFKFPFLGSSKRRAEALADGSVGKKPDDNKDKDITEPALTQEDLKYAVPHINVNAADDGTEADIAETPKSVRSVATIATEPGMLGARQMEDAEESQYREATTDNPAKMRKVGLYDVFAPPGPLGIVVDTSHDGPIIHSMKPTSSLIGLISPGDIIVGLDDMDTRSMTAATLTRLMAKRSLQSERKITLLAVDAAT